MAKQKQAQGGSEFPGGHPTNVEKAIETFAEDLGTMLGTARAKAENWIGQRQNIAKQLAEIRDTASELLSELTGTSARLAAAVGRGVRRGAKRGPGRPRKAQNPDATAAGTSPRRKFSAATIAKMRAAQRARWAKVKKAKKAKE